MMGCYLCTITRETNFYQPKQGFQYPPIFAGPHWFYRQKYLKNTLWDIFLPGDISGPALKGLINTRSLSSDTSPPTNQQFIHHMSREVDCDWSVMFRCTFLKTWESLYAVRAIQDRGYPRGFIYNYLMEILEYEPSSIFTIYSISQCIFSLDIFISFSEASVLITWIGLLYTLQWANILKGEGVFHTSGRDSKNASGCNPWGWLLASQGMKTSVWSRDTGGTSEIVYLKPIKPQINHLVNP